MLPGPATPPVPVLLVLYGLFLVASILVAWIWAIIRLALGRSIVPRFTPREVPWRGAAVLLVVAAWLAAQVLGPPIYVRLRDSARAPGAPIGEAFRPGDMMIASAIENAGLLLVLPMLLGALSGARPGDFLGPGGGSLRLVRALQGMAAWPLTAPVIYGMMILAVWIWGKGTHPLERAIQAEGLGENAWVFFLASVALAPMAEELVFRGAILGWLTRLIFRRWVARTPVSPDEVGAIEATPTEPSEWGVVLEVGHEADVALSPALGPDLARRDEFAPPDASIDDPRNSLAGARGAGPDPAPRWGAVAGRLLAANILVSILFAALHYAVWPTPVPIFFLSLVLGLLYQRTGSLVAPVALHMTFNGVSTVLMFLALGATPAHPGQGRPSPVEAPGTPAPASPTRGPVPIPVDDPTPAPAPLPKR